MYLVVRLRLHVRREVFLSGIGAVDVPAALVLAGVLYRKADLTMLLNGALAGLVVRIIVFFDKLKIDDPVGAISVHGSCGLLGLLLVPITNDAASVGGQLAAAATIFVWVFGLSAIVWMALKATIGIRVGHDQEFAGMDLNDCGIEAYPEFTRTL